MKAPSLLFGLGLLLVGGCSESVDNAVPVAAVPEAAPAPATRQSFAAVDYERLLAADSEPGQWMSTGRTYSEQHYSPLNAINRSNVSELSLA